MWHCAQVVLDFHESEQQHSINILLFDALQIGDQDFVMKRTPPAERYSQLQQLCRMQQVIVSPITMMVQWAGNTSLETMRNFCRDLPYHKAERIICYGKEHPCKLVLVLDDDDTGAG